LRKLALEISIIIFLYYLKSSATYPVWIGIFIVCCFTTSIIWILYLEFLFYRFCQNTSNKFCN